MAYNYLSITCPVYQNLRELVFNATKKASM